jgi:hypothetical protein
MGQGSLIEGAYPPSIFLFLYCINQKENDFFLIQMLIFICLATKNEIWSKF